MPRRCLLVLLALTSTLVLAAPAGAVPRIYAVSAESPPKLVSFDADTPGALRSSVVVVGLTLGEVIHGVDLRPYDGGLYLFTSAGIRALDPGTGQAGPAIALSADPGDTTAPYAAFSNASSGVDFNPIVDRLRVVSAAGENLRIAPTTGTTATDGAPNPGSPEVVGAAYVNPFPNPPSTVLYVYDAANDTLAIQSPPGVGTLTVVGSPGLDSQNDRDVGFDISAASTSTGYFSAKIAGEHNLYSISLATGAATLVGRISSGLLPIRGITAAENILSLAGPVSSAAENAPALGIVVQRANARLTSTVQYETADGTAKAGSDYTATSGTLHFGAGETSKTIVVPLLDDAAPEPSESFTVNLTLPAGESGTTATLVAPTSATATITDADPPPSTPEPVTTPTIVPVITPVPDTTAPALLIAASDLSRRTLLRRGLRVRYSCSEACSARAQLLLGSRVGATRTGTLRAAGKGAVLLRLTAAGRRALARRRSARVVLTATDTAGLRATERLTIRLR